MAFNEEKLNTLFKRVMNSTTVDANDEVALNAYIQEVFGNGYPSQHEMHQFNKLIMVQANEVAKLKSEEILNMLVDYVKLPSVQVYQYTIPREHKAKMVWTANGTSVEHVRVEGQEVRTATPVKLSTGFYYEQLAILQGGVEYFRKLVNDVADAKVRMYFENISTLLQSAIDSNAIPTVNVKTGANLTLAQYNELASVLARYGGRPVFVADTSLIDHFAFQQPTDTTFKELLTNELKAELANELSVTKLGRTTAVSLYNPFVLGSGNKVTELPVNEGYMFAGGTTMKPFKLVEFGGLTQYTTFDPNLERVEMKITQECALEFINGETVGFVRDTSVTL